jgi:hypothetical protein
MLGCVFRDRRTRFLVLCCCVLALGQLIEIFLIPHYLAPFTAAFYAIGLQAMRHLRFWTPEGEPVGVTLQRLIVTLCVVMAVVRLYAEPLHLALPVWPAAWAAEWYGPNNRSGTERENIVAQLDQLPGKKLLIVRYSSDHNPMVQWVYNTSDIDNSKIVWAWDMDHANNQKLIQYYKDRTVWLVEPDATPARILPFPQPVK